MAAVRRGLCIGGPADGDRVSTNGNVYRCLTHADGATHEYRCEPFTVMGNDVFYLFIHSMMTTTEAVAKLLRCYTPRAR